MMFGGELQGMTKNLAESRNEAMNRLITEARARASTPPNSWATGVEPRPAA